MRRSVPIRLVTLSLILGQGVPLLALEGAPRESRPAKRDEKAKPAPPATPRVTSNRTVPPVVAAPAVPHFSSPPLDAEFARARIFDEPLIPAGGARDSAEDSELASLVVEAIRSKSPDSALTFEPFLKGHPNSRWNGSLLLGLGIVYRRTGYFTRALDSWERSWAILKSESEPRLRALADRAVGELAELSARLGRADRLEQLFEEIEHRNVRGSASEKVLAARQGYTMMQNEPERAFLCGPFGLDRILASIRQGYVTDPKIRAAKSTRQGTSMRQMLELADSVGLRMQIARRTPGADVLVPALVHWKAGHFAAVTKESAGRLLIEDPTFGGDLWISREALDGEASGYFLVRVGDLPPGWQAVSSSDGESVWGKGQAGLTNSQISGIPSSIVQSVVGVGGGSNQCKGMAGYAINLLVVNLHISDAPVGYAPAVGPAMQFRVFYNQREAFQPQIPSYSNLGPKWTFDWFSYAQDDPNDLTKDVDVYLRGGGAETYMGMGAGASTSAVHYRSRAVLVRTETGIYERHLPDGSFEVFGQSDGAGIVPRRFYLTEYADPQGHVIHFNYIYHADFGGFRLETVDDALQPTGQRTMLSYENSDPFKITKVTDPFGRFATFSYDSSGRLQKITDVMGITSEVDYGDNDYVFSLTTPYGTTSFVSGNNGGFPWLEITDPLGGKERFEFNGGLATVPAGEPTPAGPPIGPNYGFAPTYLGYRNTFYWDKKAMATLPSPDYTKARIYHWLHSSANLNVASGILESEKLPLENRVWYTYPGQADGVTNIEGSAATPNTIARVLDDGSTQITKYEYNTRGMKTREIDPVGRETVYVYGTNNVPDPDPTTGTGLDLLQVKVKNNASPGGWDVTASYTYNAQHQPLTVADTAGQITTYTYDAQGRVETVTTPPRAGITEDRTTTYTYDPVTGNVASVTAPGSVDTSYTYDAYGRLQTTTDNDGYTLTYDYDGLDRQTKITYPDGTYEETVYERMDPARRRDRLGRWTHTFYDALRRPFATRDPEGRVVSQVWCSCGSLDKLIDANGNTTTWTRDLQNRVRFENRVNGSTKEFVYETTTSRLSYVKDAKLQEIHSTYGLDDKLLQTSYVNAEHATPSVTFSYIDPATSAPDAHGRLRQMTDGAGTTTYAYQPITGSPSPGAGQLASVDGPLVANDTITYGYDELGRVVSRTLNGVTSTWSYDQEGRLQSQGDPIGTFTYGYVSNSGRVQTVTYPNGQTTSYAYYPVAQDLRLQEIHHKKPDTSTLNRFTYTYDAVGNIQTWTQQTDAGPANAYDFGYDRVDQLRLATYRTTDPTPTVLKRYRYAYDPAANRTAEQIDDVVTGASYDNVNRLTSQQPGGAMLLRGTVSEPATVTVGGKPATVSPTNQFSGTASVSDGSQVAVQATDYSGNVRTNKYQMSQAGATKTFTYDPNGNLTGDGTKTYEWDAENRLLAVKQGGNTLASFTYDGSGRRSTKTAGSVTTTYVYDGAQFLEERPTPGSTKRYVYGPGIDQPLAQVVGGTTTYNVADHLGSIVRTTDSLGIPIPTLTREYDPWGNLLQGSTTSGYAFTGREWDSEAGLYYYRARYYDPKPGRFLSEDPIGIDGGDLNFYAYVRNDPVRGRDPSGLWKTAEKAALVAASRIARRSDWTKREYQCYIYKESTEYCLTDLAAAPIGVTTWVPPAFKGPGKLVGEIHNHFPGPLHNPEKFSVEDLWRARSMCMGQVDACKAFLLTPAYRVLRWDWRTFPSLTEWDPFTDTWN